MKIKCGTDIIEISRIKEGINELGERFLNRIYTKKEIMYCEIKKEQKYQHYAARFAAKEAAFKALSWNITDKYKIEGKDIEVINDDQGRPQLNIIGIDMSLIDSIDISLSHCREYVVANVTVLTK